MQITHTKYSLKRLWLYVIPLYALVVCSIFFRKSYPFYMSQPDPCYCYLFNGMNLASGHMEIGHIDHPGTPVQCFAAIVIFMKHLFSSSHLPVYQDVILNPESYLYPCSLLLILLFLVSNYLVGAYVFRHTSSVGTAMVLQLTPLVHVNIIQHVVALCPESFIATVSCFFMGYLYVQCVQNKLSDKLHGSYRTVIFFGIFSGVLIATKYICAPVTILVLFLLEKNKQRLLYVGISILSFFFFIIPAIPKMKNMYQWIWALFSHDGIYGRGEAQVINPSSFLRNLKDIFLTDTVFTSLYAIITLAVVIALINRFGKKRKAPLFRAITGVWLAITVLVLAVAKHSEFHYLIFAECCFPFGLMVAYKILSGFISATIKGFEKHRQKIAYALFSAIFLFLVIEKIRYMPKLYPSPVGISSYVDEYNDTPFIICVNGTAACERKEPALFLGYMYSGGLITTYFPFLEKTYPNTYLYSVDLQVLIHWEQTVPLTSLTEKNKEVLVYLKGYDNAKQQSLLHQFCSNPTELCDEQLIFKDQATQQSIYIIHHKSE